MTASVVDLPTETTGTEITRFNALKHGVLSRYSVLPWEDPAEYETLLAALAAEHRPQGPTEEHLVEELAGILWRKRRLRLAEAASHQHGLSDASAAYRGTIRAALAHLNPRTGDEEADAAEDAVKATPEQTAEDLRDLDEDEGMTLEAHEILRAGRADAYERAVAALRDDTREWWEQTLEEQFEVDDELPTPDTEGLTRFIEKDLSPWYRSKRAQLENRSLIRAQAIAESFDPDKLANLARYEVQLDRKLERTLSMLVRLRDLRGGPADR